MRRLVGGGMSAGSVARRQLACLAGLLALLATPRGAGALNNGLALTPPMGWMSWVRFQCNVRCDIDADNCISENLYKRMADLLVSEGYQAAGYQYVCIDDCWMAKQRDGSGRLVADPVRFPSGIAALANYMHNKGLKLGIYQNVGNETCAGYPGSKGYLQTDAQTFADWGVDMVKFDGCNANLQDYSYGYPAFGQYLLQTGRPIVYSCQWPMYARYYGGVVNYPLIAQTCNMFRALTDVYYTYQSVRSMIDYYASDPYNFTSVAGPGAWNDPDQMVLGNFGLSHAQERVNLGMWAMMAAPFLMSNDLRAVAPASKALLLNQGVIAISQDPLGHQGRMVLNYNTINVWLKPVLPPGSYALAFLNYANSGPPLLVSWTLGAVPGVDRTVAYSLIEVFDNVALGTFRPSQTIKFYVQPSGIYLVKATPSH